MYIIAGHAGEIHFSPVIQEENDPYAKPMGGSILNRKRNRRAAFVAVLASLALVAAACGDDAAEPEFGNLGGVVVAPGGPVRIATLQAISGSVANLGADQVRGIQIAIDDFGPIEGHPVLLAIEDDLCLSAGGTTGATRIISDPQILGVVGTSCSGAAVPASEIVSQAGLVMISGSNTNPTLTATGYLVGDIQRGADWSEGYFRTAHNDEYQGQGVGRFLADFLGVSSAAFIHDGDPYTNNLALEAQKEFEIQGGTTAFFGAVSKTDTDMRPILTEIAASGAEVLFFPIFQPAGDFLAIQALEISGFEDIQLMGADGLLSDTFVSIPETAGMYLSGPVKPLGNPRYPDFVAKYEAQFNELPVQAFHAHAYDAATILLTAIRSVAVAQDDGSLHIDLRELRDAMYATSNFDALIGSLTCNEFGDCGGTDIGVYRNVDPSTGILGTFDNFVWP